MTTSYKITGTFAESTIHCGASETQGKPSAFTRRPPEETIKPGWRRKPGKRDRTALLEFSTTKRGPHFSAALRLLTNPIISGGVCFWWRIFRLGSWSGRELPIMPQQADVGR